MVTHNYLEDQDEHYFSHHRRDSRGNGYSFSHDRDPSSAPPHGAFPGSRSQRYSPQENREHHPDNDLSSRPRSRIPVACGRCRKRKIRCSGDNGGPCTNCKSAGNEACQFLRVSSTETAMKCDIPTFEYDAGARMICHNIPYGPQAYRQPNPIPVESYPYRNNSISSCQYSKPLYQHYGGSFSDDNLEYGMTSELIPYIDNMGLPPNYATSNVRGWTTTPTSVSTAPLTKSQIYLEQPDTLYNHGPAPFPGNGYRLNFTPEKLVPLGSIPAPPPTLLAPASVDRVLPMPSANRPSTIPSFLHSADGLPNYNPSLYTSPTELSGNRTTKSNNSGPVTENSPIESAPSGESYGSLANNTSEHIGGQHMGYPPQVPNYDHQLEDNNYTARNGSRSFDQGLQDNSFHRGSISGHSPRRPQESPSLPPTNPNRSITSIPPDGTRILSNGQEYYPYVSPTSSYPQPPVHLQPQHSHSHSPPTVQVQRPDINGIPAA